MHNTRALVLEAPLLFDLTEDSLDQYHNTKEAGASEGESIIKINILLHFLKSNHSFSAIAREKTPSEDILRPPCAATEADADASSEASQVPSDDATLSGNSGVASQQRSEDRNSFVAVSSSSSSIEENTEAPVLEPMTTPVPQSHAHNFNQSVGNIPFSNTFGGTNLTCEYFQGATSPVFF